MTEQNLSWLGPTLLFLGGVIVAAINGAAVVWRRRQDKKDVVANTVAGKQMSEVEEADEVRKARAEATRFYNYYVTFRSLFYQVQEALRHLVRRLGNAHPDMELGADVVDALALKGPDADTTK